MVLTITRNLQNAAFPTTRPLLIITKGAWLKPDEFTTDTHPPALQPCILAFPKQNR